MTASEQMLYLFTTCAIIMGVLTGAYLLLWYTHLKRKREYNDKAVQAMLDEMRLQRMKEYSQHPPASTTIINVDFTEELPVGSADPSALKYKIVYDEHLGIYRKVPR